MPLEAYRLQNMPNNWKVYMVSFVLFATTTKLKTMSVGVRYKPASS